MVSTKTQHHDIREPEHTEHLSHRELHERFGPTRPESNHVTCESRKRTKTYITKRSAWQA
jgi:hypothetical protein